MQGNWYGCRVGMVSTGDVSELRETSGCKKGCFLRIDGKKKNWETTKGKYAGNRKENKYSNTYGSRSSKILAD